jgi:hypothetical protein
MDDDTGDRRGLTMKSFWPAAWYIGAPLGLAAWGGVVFLAVFELATAFGPRPAEPVRHVHVPVKMRLFVGPCKINRPCRVTLYIRGAEPGDQVFLHVPPGMELADGESKVRTVPPPGPPGYASVAWRLIPREQGRFVLQVHGPDGSLAQEQVTVRVLGGGLFDD